MSGATVECLSAFGDKTAPPGHAGLRRVLGPSAEAWDALVERVSATCAPVVTQWNFAGARFGWSMRLKKRDRAVVYLIPRSGSFLVGLVLGDCALAAARDAGLPQPVLDEIAGARRYAEGTGFRLPVRSKADLPPIETLVALKMSR